MSKILEATLVQNHVGQWFEGWSAVGLLYPLHCSTKITFKHSLNSWQDYGVIMNRAAPHIGTVCLATFKHDLTGNRPTQTLQSSVVQ